MYTQYSQSNTAIYNHYLHDSLPISEVETPDGFMTVKDIAQYFDCHPETIRELIRNEHFKNVKKHLRNSYMVSVEEIEKYYREKISMTKDYMNISQDAKF